MNKMPLVYILDEENTTLVYPQKNYIKNIMIKAKKYKNELIVIGTIISVIGLSFLKQRSKK